MQRVGTCWQFILSRLIDHLPTLSMMATIVSPPMQLDLVLCILIRERSEDALFQRKSSDQHVHRQACKCPPWSRNSWCRFRAGFLSHTAQWGLVDVDDGPVRRVVMKEMGYGEEAFVASAAQHQRPSWSAATRMKTSGVVLYSQCMYPTNNIIDRDFI